MIWAYTDINLSASETDKKSLRPIHHLPIYTDADSNRFLGLLTLLTPIFTYEYHNNTYANVLENTNLPILIIPIIGLTLLCKQMRHTTRYYSLHIENYTI